MVSRLGSIIALVFLTLVSILPVPGALLLPHEAALLLMPQEAAADDSKLLHEPVTLETLPAPGLPFKLRVRIANDQKRNASVRALVSRDGDMLEVLLDEVEIAESGDGFYTGVVNAPLISLSYQFIVAVDKKPVITSKRFSVQRECVPRVDLIKVEPLTSPSMKEKVETLVRQAKKLEGELAAYDQAIALLDDLNKLIKELGL